MPKVKTIEELLENISKTTPLPWRADRHPDPLCRVLYIRDANDYEVCSFFGDFEHSAAAIQFILEVANAHYVPPPPVKEEEPCEQSS